jgi:hypothetical protein
MHFPGDASGTRPLQPTPQLSDEHNEMSSAAFSTYNPPPSMHDSMDPFLGSAFGPASIHLRAPHTMLDISHIVAKKSNTAFSINDALLSSSTPFAHSNPIKPALMRPLNNEHITPENGAQPHYSSYDAESASQCIDVTGRTIVDCAQQIFSMTATERMEGERSPQIAMKRCLCPGTPDPPTHLASATMHKKGLRAVARLNWGAPFAGADIIKRVGCITATNATVALGEWDASSREMSIQLPNLAKLRKIVRINGARIKSGAPIAGESDGEQTWCFTATNTTVALCEWDTSSRKVSSRISRVMSLKKIDLVDERGQRYQTKGKFGGSGRSSRSHSPGKDNHETARGSQ